ncbi:phage tail protein [Telmatospirillum siberiense]|uniref:phage tail protein n=1 Tax=Telmatospirillum siberiense TaxID=382514 RepID=UPI0011AF4F6D|nr:phage tail protein [Telmatospirillum siberiense]
MPTFALITEGITDQVVIETIIQGYYSGQLDDELDFNPLQPVRDATDESRQGGFGGWENVLEYCSYSDRIREAIALNDFVVIQIDTDCCEEKNFGVYLTKDGNERDAPDIIFDVISKIVGIIGDDIYLKHKEKLIFAIAVHSIECWLIPLHMKKMIGRKRTHSCEDHLGRAIKQNGLEYSKNYDVYFNIVMPYRKRKNIELNKMYNRSFEIFIESMPDPIRLNKLF